ncbi:retron system putative HNH endonuclease [Thalassotalea crassostreae]|uniref:retron system putative HNH endonuclease n=1 Tax=Thalassotalea crassostreae TaxID=1763536 RepID=UPI0008393FB0|nr:retron system putative HNH endonuclease [Thalassotalea crassostreae]
MRKISKLPTFPLNDLNRANQPVPPQNSHEASSRWGRFNSDNVYKRLAMEQYGLCAYTELNIQDFRVEHQSIKGGHIEHMKPKSAYPLQTFDYQNLVLNALDSEDLTQFASNQSFGGQYKQSNFDQVKFLNPVSNNVRDYFEYLETSGEIIPKSTLSDTDSMKARYMIDLLNLNAPYLMNKRAQWCAEINSVIDEMVVNQDYIAFANFKMFETEKFPRFDEVLRINYDQVSSFYSLTEQLFK